MPTADVILSSIDATVMADIEYAMSKQAHLEGCIDARKINLKAEESRARMFAQMYHSISTSARDHLLRDAAAADILRAESDPLALW